ncbi:MAG: hypothetical protein MJ211_11760 [Bacteroidales bacterium]|nr:hypothetical protein [Bacteroidales bacterium]
MKNKSLIIILLGLIIISNGLWVYFHFKYKHNAELYLQEADRYITEYAALKTNLTYNISNPNEKLEDLIIYNNRSKEKKLSDLFNDNEELLICRISDSYCNDCNYYSHLTIENQTNNVIYIVNQTRKNAINNIISSFELDTARTYGTERINLSAEKYMFPYYIKVDKNLNVIQVYFPTRQLENLDKELLEDYVKE